VSLIRTVAERAALAVLTEQSLQHVLFVAGVEEAPLRYRVYHPAEALGLLNITSQICFYTDQNLERAADGAGLVVLHRVKATAQILDFITSTRRKGIPILSDVDDLIFDVESARAIPWLNGRSPNEVDEFLEDVGRYRTTIDACDGLITSTSTLRTEAEKLIGIPSRCFPNGVGLRLDHLSQAAVEKIPFSRDLRMGFLSGTNTHALDFGSIELAIAKILEQFLKSELWMVGNIEAPNSLLRFGQRVRRIPMLPWQRLPQLTRQLGVNLAPLTLGNVFNETKSQIKWLEAALVEVPTIASPTQPFREMIRHGENGFLASSPAEWIQCLATLLQDPNLRERMGKHAREDAIEQLNANRQGQRYLEIFEWARKLGSTSRRSTAPAAILPERLVKPHALEPYDLMLLDQRTSPQTITSDLSNTVPVEFEIDIGETKDIRLDLLFATHNGPGANVEVRLKNLTADSLNSDAIAKADQISEGAWAAFNFRVGPSPGRYRVQVKLSQSDTTKKSRVALWADLSGNHFYGEETRTGLPCMRLWVDEGHAVKAPPSSTAVIGVADQVVARIRFALYLYKVDGWRQTTARLLRFISRKATTARLKETCF